MAAVSGFCSLLIHGCAAWALFEQIPREIGWWAFLCGLLATVIALNGVATLFLGIYVSVDNSL